MEPIRLYSSPAMRAVTGPTLRPGGFSLTDRAAEILDLPENALVLDLGCGTGSTVDRLASRRRVRAVGLDFSPALLGEGRQGGSPLSLVAGRAEQTPFRDHSFDSVFCECVLSLLEDPAAALVEAGRILKPGGRLILTDVFARRPEGVSVLRRLPFQSCLRGARPKGEILGLVRAAGLETVLWEDHSNLLKRLAAELVFEHGSMRSFWAAIAPQCPCTLWADVQDLARPGYYLLAAGKRS